MDVDSSWRVIASERRSLADLLEQLTDEQWETPSLCAGWRVRDVAAHIAMVPTAPGPLAMARGAVRAHGNFNRLNHDLAVRHARRPTADIVAELRDEADSRRLPSVTSVTNLGFDILVHGQDIAIPLGCDQTDADGRRHRRRGAGVGHGVAVLGAPPTPRIPAHGHRRELVGRRRCRGPRSDRRAAAPAHRQARRVDPVDRRRRPCAARADRRHLRLSRPRRAQRSRAAHAVEARPTMRSSRTPTGVAHGKLPPAASCGCQPPTPAGNRQRSSPASAVGGPGKGR